MNDLDQLRALVSGASTATDTTTGLAYVAAARAVGRRLAEDLRSARIHLDAIEKEFVRRGQGVQAALPGSDS